MKINNVSILLFYMILINIINFILFKTDKKRARKREWRIPESTLLVVSLLGGTIGGLIGMMHFRHKTKKLKFRLGMPIILIINIFMIKYLLNVILTI